MTISIIGFLACHSIFLTEIVSYYILIGALKVAVCHCYEEPAQPIDRDVCILITQRKLLCPCRYTSCLTYCFFYIYGSVHCNYILIRSDKMKQYGGIYLLQFYSTCFGFPSHSSSGELKKIIAASDTGHMTYLRNNLGASWPN